MQRSDHFDQPAGGGGAGPQAVSPSWKLLLNAAGSGASSAIGTSGGGGSGGANVGGYAFGGRDGGLSAGVANHRLGTGGGVVGTLALDDEGI